MSKYKVGEEICTKTYEDGIADAWEAAKKIYLNESEGGLPDADMDVIFGDSWHVGDILRGNTPQEAIAKIKEWESSKQIRRGDEVTYSDLTGVVISDKIEYKVLWNDGNVGHSAKQCCPYVKTGRNFADKLDALLGEIGEE